MSVGVVVVVVVVLVVVVVVVVVGGGGARIPERAFPMHFIIVPFPHILPTTTCHRK